jgi:hypothetical protein
LDLNAVVYTLWPLSTILAQFSSRLRQYYGYRHPPALGSKMVAIEQTTIPVLTYPKVNLNRLSSSLSQGLGLKSLA